MYKKGIERILTCLIAYIFLLSIFLEIEVQAVEVNNSYVLLYDNLYGYGEQTSDTLQLYIKLKSNNQYVRLLQIDDISEDKIEKDAKIILISSSFDSKEEYNETLEYLKSLGLKSYDERKIYSDKVFIQKGLMIGINEVYPFSDLNKLMDISENLNDRGIEFICTIMPVYENYELEAYEKFIEVVKYINKRGGQIFVHYPVINEEVTYDTDPKAGLEKAIGEYRRRGLEIRGITLSEDKLLMNSKAIQDLNVQILLVTEPKAKVDVNLDLHQITKKIDKYILIKGDDITSFNIFLYKDNNCSNGDLVYLTMNDDVKKLNELFNYLYSEKITIKDFKVKDYEKTLSNINATKSKEISISGNNKTQLDKFREEELKKIKGENIREDQKSVQAYDLSKPASIAIKIAFAIILLLIVQVIIARRYDNKKFFDD
ncbi:DUF2334 domain-containing protein [Wukongibacter sp. M2B1]|uniref:DUF2334 domain-containing protein n=1 Tax=Wukongibacter sp. M2B1 TaxID=3088895 RepID=UPI003D7B9AD3